MGRLHFFARPWRLPEFGVVQKQVIFCNQLTASPSSNDVDRILTGPRDKEEESWKMEVTAPAEEKQAGKKPAADDNLEGGE
ncbi:hypothetical protein E4U59_000404 [Claviceps monticola]|nr:hypothetical protein E4U59_000404 [Claviceps monticola]